MTDDRRQLPTDCIADNWLMPGWLSRPEPQPWREHDRVFIPSRGITGTLIAARTLGVEPYAVRQLLVATDIGARLWFRPEEVERLIESAAPVRSVRERLRPRHPAAGRGFWAEVRVMRSRCLLRINAGPHAIAAERLERALDAINLVEMAAVPPIDLAKRLIALRSECEHAIARLREREPTA